MVDILKRLKAMEEFFPESGFNVVGIDDYEPPGEELYLIGHYDTKEEAEKVRDGAIANDVTAYIYDSTMTKSDD